MNKTIKVALSMLLIFCVFFANMCTVFAVDGDQSTTSGGLTKYDGSLLTYDYAKKNPKLFTGYDIDPFDINSLPTHVAMDFNMWINTENGDSSKIQVLNDMVLNSYWMQTLGNKDPLTDFSCVNAQYVYLFVSYVKGSSIKQKIVVPYFSSYPLAFKDGFIYVSTQNDSSTSKIQVEYRNDKPYLFSGTLGGGLFEPSPTAPRINVGGVEYAQNMQLYSSSLFSQTLVYPINGKIMPILNENNEVMNPGDGSDNPDSKKFRVQEKMEYTSDYVAKNYPNAPNLETFTSWYKDPESVYLDEDVDIGDKKQYRGFYFQPALMGGTGIKIKVLEKGRYTYHIYYKNADGDWRKSSIWSSKILKFVKGYKDVNGNVTPPKLISQKDNFGVIYSYDDNTFKAFRRPNIDSINTGNATEEIILNGAFYIIADNGAIKNDDDTSNNGSITTDEDGNMYDSDGNYIGKGEELPNGSFRPPPKPGPNDGFFAWFDWFFLSVGNFFKSFSVMMKKLISECENFFKFIGSSFSFLPPEIIGILALGISIVILLRIFGR